MTRIISLLAVAVFATMVSAQTGVKKVYDEELDPFVQIEQALARAGAEGKFVVCQVGGNWCPWCLRFADFISHDSIISQVIEENFEYIHVNYDPRKAGAAESSRLIERLGGCARFGFPVLVVLRAPEGAIVHIQDSSFLEEGKGYDREKVLRFFRCWTPKAVGPSSKTAMQ